LIGFGKAEKLQGGTLHQAQFQRQIEEIGFVGELEKETHVFLVP